MKKIVGTKLEIKLIINGIFRLENKGVETAQVSASNYAH